MKEAVSGAVKIGKYGIKEAVSGAVEIGKLISLKVRHKGGSKRSCKN
jgi:hypothetical protein